MPENMINQISIVSVSLLNLFITGWYCWLTYKQKIKPALAMWIFFTIAVAISLTTYLKSDNFSLLDNILNTTDMALAICVTIAIYLWETTLLALASSIKVALWQYLLFCCFGLLPKIMW